uniref:Uncharacterized protein n=1 Tax=Cacopsylla melanoneura TaxID=428564 RepID=A0A8D9ARN7_9HEMI
MTEVIKPIKVSTSDWQSTSCTVAERFRKLFELAEWSDCKFLVGSNEPRTIPVHRYSVHTGCRLCPWYPLCRQEISHPPPCPALCAIPGIEPVYRQPAGHIEDSRVL